MCMQFYFLMIYIDILLPFQTRNFYCLQEQNSTEPRASQGYRVHIVEVLFPNIHVVPIKLHIQVMAIQ